MKRDHVTSILCFDRKINVLPIFNLQGAVADVWSYWYSAVMDGSGLQDKDLWTPDWIPVLNSLAKQLTELAFVVAFLIHLTMHKRTETWGAARHLHECLQMSHEGRWCGAGSTFLVAAGKRGRSACPAVLQFYYHTAVDGGSWSSDAALMRSRESMHVRWVSVGEFCCRGGDGWQTPPMRKTFSYHSTTSQSSSVLTSLISVFG